MGLEIVRLSGGFGLFAAEAQPDQVDRPADSNEQADQGENSLVEPFVQPVADATPEKQAR